MKPPIALVKLDPHWVENEGKVMGVSFDCPEHATPENWCRQVVPFTPAMDGSKVKTWQQNGAHWKRVGGTYHEDQNLDGFSDLTLTPSVKAGCGWHGFITKGVVTCCKDSK
jgi:hypothetical protein